MKIATITVEPAEDAQLPNIDGWVYAALCNWAARTGAIYVGKSGRTIWLNTAKRDPNKEER